MSPLTASYLTAGVRASERVEQVCQRFDCLSVTLEQPFKDCFDMQEPHCGYSPARCRRLGAAVLDPLACRWCLLGGVVVVPLHHKFGAADQKATRA